MGLNLECVISKTKYMKKACCFCNTLFVIGERIATPASQARNDKGWAFFVYSVSRAITLSMRRWWRSLWENSVPSQVSAISKASI